MLFDIGSLYIYQYTCIFFTNALYKANITVQRKSHKLDLFQVF